MACRTIPPSPNWFWSSAGASNANGTFVYASRTNVYVFDISTPHEGPKLVSVFTEHSGKITSVALCPGRKLASANLGGPAESAANSDEDRGTMESLCCSGGNDMDLRIWDFNTLTTVQIHKEHKEKITCVAWSPVNTSLVASGDEMGNLILWNRKMQKAFRWRTIRDYYIYCLAFCPHEPALLAVGTQKGRIMLVDFSSGPGQLKLKLQDNEQDIMSVSWCPIRGEHFLKELADAYGASGSKDAERPDKGCLLASGSKDRTIRVWSCSKGRQLFFKRVPALHYNSGESRKAWIAVHWLEDEPDRLLSSSTNGDLLLWFLPLKSGKQFQEFQTGGFKIHSRPIFCICRSGNTIATFSQDRLVVLWDLALGFAVSSLPTLGGYGYSIRRSPLDPGRVAIGGGDMMIYIWNTFHRTNPFDISSRWQGIKEKVTTVAWHPHKEGILAFGLDDGRVGVIDIFHQNRSPAMSILFHQRMVHIVEWGPSITQPGLLVLYSLGDHCIFEHTPTMLMRVNMNDYSVEICCFLQKNNPEKLGELKATEMAWNMDLNVYAVGTNEGTVLIFPEERPQLMATIKLHHKMVTCMRWHPVTTYQCQFTSSYKSWLATGGADATIHVVDLSSVVYKRGEHVVIFSSLRKLEGHTERVTDMSWSLYDDGRLVSVGYHSEAIVWDVPKGVPLCQFTGHQGRILSCQYSGVDPDFVMSSGMDACIMVWRVSQQPSVDLYKLKKKKRMNAEKPSEPEANQRPTSEAAASESAKVGVGSEVAAQQTSAQETSSAVEEVQGLLEEKRVKLEQTSAAAVDELQEMLEEKRVELEQMLQGSDNLDKGVQTGAPELPMDDGYLHLEMALPKNDSPQFRRGLRGVAVVPVEERSSEEGESETEETGGQGARPKAAGARAAGPTQQGRAEAKKKRRPKSCFPELAKAENRGRATTYDDLRFLTTCKSAREEAEESTPEELPSERQHLGIFIDKQQAARCIDKEIKHHLNHDNMDYALQMEIWKGNTLGAIQWARERGQLSDWLVAITPLASYETWMSVSEEYAEQLEDEGQYHKAVSFLLACHKPYPAIDLFRRHKLYREAVALAKVKLLPTDPVVEDLYLEWSEQLMRDGAYEQAAKCYLAVKHIQDAANAVARRWDQNSLQAACHITLLANEKQKGQLYAHQAVMCFLSTQHWKQALSFCKEHQPLKLFVPYVSVHEMVLRELSAMVPDIVPAIETERSENWGSGSVDKLCIPEFIIDPNEADPVLPWEMHLVEGHAFPHHVLRVWHLHLGVTMETEQLHLMYHALQQMQSGRQTHRDIQQLLVQVCADITLWLLAVLTNQTSLAISHLLAILSTLHEGGHLTLLAAICRLLLPLGPKYMLKLQQEVSALRVLINMESQGEVEGGGKHLSLRRYLTELKDDPSVSTGALRCRQLDCIRAYFYLSILHYLQQSFASRNNDACRPDTSVSTSGSSSGVSSTDSLMEKVSPGSRQDEGLIGSEKDEPDSEGKHSSSVDDVGDVKGDVGSADGGSDVKVDSRSRGGDRDGGCTDGGDKSSVSDVPVKERGSGDGENSSSISKVWKSLGSPTKKLASPQKKSLEKGSDEPWHLSLPRLLQLSKGLLWDLQAKRLALTDTLGHIHWAISQHLLTDRSQEVAKTLSRQTHLGSTHSYVHAFHNQHTHTSILPDMAAAYLPGDLSSDVEDGTAITMETEESTYTAASALAGVTGDDSRVSFEKKRSSSLSSQSSTSSAGGPLSRTNSVDTPSTSVENQPLVPNLEALPESNFDLHHATWGQQWDGSRRVLWEDDALSQAGREGEGHRVGGDSSSHKPTCLLSPAKYINMPDEWYSLPVDEKYMRPYVTLAILKEEQVFVMGELKRTSDSSQVPFPIPFNTTELLLDVCLSNVAMPTEDKHNYIKSLQSWAMHFAVTSQQRSQVDALIARAQKEIGL